MEKSVVETLLRGLIESNRKGDELREAFTREHRTHQQMIGGTILELIHNLGELYGGPDRSRYFDGRNDHLGKICFEINTFMENHRHDMWYKLPLI